MPNRYPPSAARIASLTRGRCARLSAAAQPNPRPLSLGSMSGPCALGPRGALEEGRGGDSPVTVGCQAGAKWANDPSRREGGRGVKHRRLVPQHGAGLSVHRRGTVRMHRGLEARPAPVALLLAERVPWSCVGH